MAVPFKTFALPLYLTLELPPTLVSSVCVQWTVAVDAPLTETCAIFACRSTAWHELLPETVKIIVSADPLSVAFEQPLIVISAVFIVNFSARQELLPEIETLPVSIEPPKDT